MDTTTFFCGDHSSAEAAVRECQKPGFDRLALPIVGKGCKALALLGTAALYQVAEGPELLFLDLNVRKIEVRIAPAPQKNRNLVTRQTLVC
jgi:hypothetical protein